MMYMTYFEEMKPKQFFFTVLAGLWVFFFIADGSARFISRFSFLRGKSPLAFIAQALHKAKGLSVFLLIVANIVLIVRSFEKNIARQQTRQGL